MRFPGSDYPNYKKSLSRLEREMLWYFDTIKGKIFRGEDLESIEETVDSFYKSGCFYYDGRLNPHQTLCPVPRKTKLEYYNERIWLGNRRLIENRKEDGN